jgi:hypothetical protein
VSGSAGHPLVYTDLASLGTLPKYTCGHLYYYPAFSPGRDGKKLGHDLRHNLTRPTAWEAVMRIRCSKGLRISTFHGHFFIRSSDLLALPQASSSTSPSPPPAWALLLNWHAHTVTVACRACNSRDPHSTSVTVVLWQHALFCSLMDRHMEHGALPAGIKLWAFEVLICVWSCAGGPGQGLCSADCARGQCCGGHCGLPAVRASVHVIQWGAAHQVRCIELQISSVSPLCAAQEVGMPERPGSQSSLLVFRVIFQGCSSLCHAPKQL